MQLVDATSAVTLDELAALFGASELEALRDELQSTHAALERRPVWNINSTAQGGGVAEMLHAIVGYSRLLDLDVRWAVIGGDPGFFEVTKRLHNNLHGDVGDGGALGERERRIYERALAPAAEACRAQVRAGDFVICHDPQTAGLLPVLRAIGARVVWRCHIGHDAPNDITMRAWQFLGRYLPDAEVLVFTRPSYVPGEFEAGRCVFIHPAIDPLSAKNRNLDEPQVGAILEKTGLIANGFDPDLVPAIVDRPAGIVREGGPLDPATALVTQVSRWDRLKDPIGVMRGFVDHVADLEAALVLAGPDVDGVTDDPEGKACLDEVREAWSKLEPAQRRRVHIVSLPMHDLAANALMVNALQRHSAVVVQKSLQEGFGLTVSEAMWKAKPVVASKVGGIQDQIEHGRSGLLVDDPEDLPGFAAAVRSALEDEDRASRLGEAARRRVRERFLITGTLKRYAQELTRLAAAA